jgi:YALI0D08338p
MSAQFPPNNRQPYPRQPMGGYQQQGGYQQGGYQQAQPQQGGYQQGGYQQGGYQQARPQQGGYQQAGPQQRGYQQGGQQRYGAPMPRQPRPAMAPMDDSSGDTTRKMMIAAIIAGVFVITLVCGYLLKDYFFSEVVVSEGSSHQTTSEAVASTQIHPFVALTTPTASSESHVPAL